MINIYSDLERPGIDFDFMSLSFDWKVFLYWWWVVKLPSEVHVWCKAQPGQWQRWWMLVFLVLLWYFGKICTDNSYLEPRMSKYKLGFGAFLQNNIQKSFTLRVGPEIKLQCKQNKAKVSRAWFQQRVQANLQLMVFWINITLTRGFKLHMRKQTRTQRSKRSRLKQNSCLEFMNGKSELQASQVQIFFHLSLHKIKSFENCSGRCSHIKASAHISEEGWDAHSTGLNQVLQKHIGILTWVWVMLVDISN